MNSISIAAPAATATAIHGIVVPSSLSWKKSCSHGTTSTIRNAPPIAPTRATRHHVYGRAMIASTHMEVRKSVSVAALVSAFRASGPV